MKTATFICTLCVVALFAINAECKHIAPDVKNIWKNLTDPYQNVCLGHSPINSVHSEVMIKNAYVGNSKSFGCYLKCVFEKIDVLKPDGEFDVHAILDKLPYMTENITQKCIDEGKGETDGCLKSLIVGNCAVKAYGVD
ncbi:hypothetical protein FQR65_LT00477 [Abscondita terminalis]|nr:hypothetical protein FQR65_LT00477 [Abscondita terminalis]